jgi:hypothetical protein
MGCRASRSEWIGALCTFYGGSFAAGAAHHLHPFIFILIPSEDDEDEDDEGDKIPLVGETGFCFCLL